MSSGAKPASKRVMIVEAEISVRTLAAEKLREAGLRVVEAANDDEAAVYLRNGDPVDVVFRGAELTGDLQAAAEGD
jgi:CheY-like chemotaxis protein